MTGPRRPAGFTLIEMLAVVVLLGIVFLVAIDFYLDLSRASNAAAERTREGRRATAALDRVARDLGAAFLVRKPAAVDPLEHPWLFLAEADEPSIGAARLKFVTRGRLPRRDAGAESDLEMVAWQVADDGFGQLALWRWSSPHLAEGLDRSFPRPDAPGSNLVIEGIARFGVRLLGEDGAWVARWDSSQLLQSSELPRAAEITLAFAAPEDLLEGGEPETWQRRVLMPIRPLDLEAQLEAEGASRDEDEEEDEEEKEPQDCVTVGQCLARHPELAAGLDPILLQAVQSRAQDCASDFAASLPVGLPEDCR